MLQILLWLVVTLTAEPLIFRIPDGTKRDSYIGNLPQNAKLNTPSDVNLRKFVLVTGSDLIQVKFKSFLNIQFYFTFSNKKIKVWKFDFLFFYSTSFFFMFSQYFFRWDMKLIT